LAAGGGSALIPAIRGSGDRTPQFGAAYGFPAKTMSRQAHHLNMLLRVPISMPKKPIAGSPERWMTGRSVGVDNAGVCDLGRAEPP
jgi:hypothetical protein